MMYFPELGLVPNPYLLTNGETPIYGDFLAMIPASAEGNLFQVVDALSKSDLSNPKKYFQYQGKEGGPSWFQADPFGSRVEQGELTLGWGSVLTCRLLFNDLKPSSRYNKLSLNPVILNALSANLA